MCVCVCVCVSTTSKYTHVDATNKNIHSKQQHEPPLHQQEQHTSNLGPIILQGGHHLAVKSTTTLALLERRALNSATFATNLTIFDMCVCVCCCCLLLKKENDCFVLCLWHLYLQHLITYLLNSTTDAMCFSSYFWLLAN